MGLMFLEVVYETGRMSVMEVDSEEEGMEGLRVHHQKAIKGEPGGPLGQPAERVAAVYVYDEHPDDFNSDQTMSADVLEKELSNLVKTAKDKNGVVNVDVFTVGVRALTHPMNNSTDVEGFGSRYRMKENKKLDLKFLEGSVA
jgi:hypothetical protein